MRSRDHSSREIYLRADNSISIDSASKSRSFARCPVCFRCGTPMQLKRTEDQYVGYVRCTLSANGVAPPRRNGPAFRRSWRLNRTCGAMSQTHYQLLMPMGSRRWQNWDALSGTPSSRERGPDLTPVPKTVPGGRGRDLRSAPLASVRFGSKTDMCGAMEDVRFGSSGQTVPGQNSALSAIVQKRTNVGVRIGVRQKRADDGGAATESKRPHQACVHSSALAPARA